MNLFYVNKNSFMRVDEILPMEAAVELTQHLIYYMALNAAYITAPKAAHPIFSTTGQVVEGTADELLAWAGRAYGHDSISSVLMSSLHFENPFSKRELDTMYLKQKIDHPIFQRLMD